MNATRYNEMLMIVDLSLYHKDKFIWQTRFKDGIYIRDLIKYLSSTSLFVVVVVVAYTDATKERLVAFVITTYLIQLKFYLINSVITYEHLLCIM